MQLCLLFFVQNINELFNHKTFKLSKLGLRYFLHPEGGSNVRLAAVKPTEEEILDASDCTCANPLHSF